MKNSRTMKHWRAGDKVKVSGTGLNGRPVWFKGTLYKIDGFIVDVKLYVYGNISYPVDTERIKNLSYEKRRARRALIKEILS